MAKFEIVVMSEIIEHLENPEVALNSVKKFFAPQTVGFITFPNTANPEVVENENKHGFHLQHWNAGEFYALITQHFNNVVMFSVDKLEQWNPEETVDGDSTDYLIVAKVEGIK